MTETSKSEIIPSKSEKEIDLTSKSEIIVPPNVSPEELAACEKDTTLLLILIQRMTDKNVKAWDELSNIPSNVIKYYRESFDRLYTAVMETPQFEGFKNGTLKIKHDNYVFVSDYFTSVCDTILRILSNLVEAKSSKTAKTLHEKLKNIVEHNQAHVTVESATNLFICPTKDLTHFFFELHEFLEKEMSKIKSTELDAVQTKTTKLIAVTPEEVARAKIIRTAAKCSNDAYVTEKTRVAYEGKWFGDIISTQTKGKEQWSGFVDYREKYKAIFVAFHGTRGNVKDEIMADVLADVGAIPASDIDDLQGKTVHYGFFRRYAGVKKDMKQRLGETIKDLKEKGKEWDKIIVTGHSLGGAIATLAAVNLVNDETLDEEIRDKVQLITFCQPRVFTTDAYYLLVKDEKLKTYALEKNAIRIWRKGDFVPTLPWESFGYKHFGQSWCITSGYSGLFSYGPNKHFLEGVIDLLKEYAKGEDIQMFLEETTHIAAQE